MFVDKTFNYIFSEVISNGAFQAMWVGIFFVLKKQTNLKQTSNVVWCVCAFSILIEVQEMIHSVDHATLLDKPGLKQHFWFTYFENNFGDPCCTTRFQ